MSRIEISAVPSITHLHASIIKTIVAILVQKRRFILYIQVLLSREIQTPALHLTNSLVS